MKSPKSVTFYILPEVDAMITRRSQHLGITRAQYIESLVVREFTRPENSDVKSLNPKIPKR